MKRVLYSFVIMFCCLFTGASPLVAYSARPGKCVISAVELLHSTNHIAGDPLQVTETTYPKLAKRFSALFPEAKEPKWRLYKGVFFVRFSQPNGVTDAVFIVTGKLKYAITELDETQLPVTVKEALHNHYPLHKVFHLREIQIPVNTQYMVVLHDAAGYVTVQVSDGEVRELQRLEKINPCGQVNQ